MAKFMGSRETNTGTQVSIVDCNHRAITVAENPRLTSIEWPVFDNCPLIEGYSLKVNIARIGNTKRLQ